MECSCVDASWRSSISERPGSLTISAVLLAGWLGLAAWFAFNYSDVAITWTIMLKDLNRARNFLVAFTYFWLGVACLLRIAALITLIIHSSLSENDNCVIDRTDVDFAISVLMDLGTVSVLAIISTLATYFMATYYTNQAAMNSDNFDDGLGPAKFQKPWMYKPAQIGFAVVNVVVLAVFVLKNVMCLEQQSAGNAMEIALTVVVILHVFLLARGGKLLVKGTGVQKPGLRGTERMIFWVMLCLAILAIFYALRFVDDYLYFHPDRSLAQHASWDTVSRTIPAFVELAMLGVILNRIRPQGRAETEKRGSLKKEKSFSSHGSFLVRKDSNSNLVRGNSHHEIGRSIDLSGLVAERKSEASPSWLQNVLAMEKMRKSSSDRGSFSQNVITPLDDPDAPVIIKVRGGSESINSLPTHYEDEGISEAEEGEGGDVSDASELDVETRGSGEYEKVATPVSENSSTNS